MKTIDTTQGMNGYPRNTGTDKILESLEEFNAFKEKGYNFFPIYRRRDGWDFWEYVGSTSDPFDMVDEMLRRTGDCDEVFWLDDNNMTYEDVLDAVRQNWDCDDIYYEDEIEKREKCKKWIEEIAKEMKESLDKDYGNVFVLRYLEGIRESYHRHVVHYHDYDVYEYAIGKPLKI